VTRSPVQVDLHEVDTLRFGHGVEIDCRSDDDTGYETLAFIVGFAWRHGERAEVEVLRPSAPEWAHVGGHSRLLRDELVAVIRDVLAGAPLLFTRGRFRVIANS